MSGKLVEITLQSLKVDENGEIAEKGNNVLTVSLVYPSPGNPSLSTVKTLKLKDGAEINYESGTNPDTDSQYTYLDRILFKEEIYHETMLIIQLTEVQTLSGIEKFIGGIFKGVFKAAWGALTKGIGNVILAEAAESVSNLHLDSIKLEKDTSTNIIGRASLPLKTVDLPSSGESRIYPCDLTVPKDVEISHFKTDPPGSRPKRVDTRLLNANTKNGEITIKITVL